MGTWVAYEFLRLVRKTGLPMPRKAWLSALASPDLPEPQRPWRQQRTLGEQDFKASDEMVWRWCVRVGERWGGVRVGCVAAAAHPGKHDFKAGDSGGCWWW